MIYVCDAGRHHRDGSTANTATASRFCLFRFRCLKIALDVGGYLHIFDLKLKSKMIFINKQEEVFLCRFSRMNMRSKFNRRYE